MCERVSRIKDQSEESGVIINIPHCYLSPNDYNVDPYDRNGQEPERPDGVTVTLLRCSPGLAF